jgi:hypothetical protein
MLRRFVAAPFSNGRYFLRGGRKGGLVNEPGGLISVPVTCSLSESYRHHGAE